MSWLRLDDGFADHPKVLELERPDRWRWLELLTLCARYNTRGAVTIGMLRSADIRPALRRRLLELRLLEPGAPCTCEEPDKCADGPHVHDWPLYNPVRDPSNRDRQARYRARTRAETRGMSAPPWAELRTQSPSTPPEQPSTIPPERNALHPRHTVTPAPLPPVPVPQELPPQTPPPPAAGGASSTEPATIGDTAAAELERLRGLADDPPAWPADGASGAEEGGYPS